MSTTPTIEQLTERLATVEAVLASLLDGTGHLAVAGLHVLDAAGTPRITLDVTDVGTSTTTGRPVDVALVTAHGPAGPNGGEQLASLGEDGIQVWNEAEPVIDLRWSDQSASLTVGRCTGGDANLHTITLTAGSDAAVIDLTGNDDQPFATIAARDLDAELSVWASNSAWGAPGWSAHVEASDGCCPASVTASER